MRRDVNYRIRKRQYQSEEAAAAAKGNNECSSVVPHTLNNFLFGFSVTSRKLGRVFPLVLPPPPGIITEFVFSLDRRKKRKGWERSRKGQKMANMVHGTGKRNGFFRDWNSMERS